MTAADVRAVQRLWDANGTRWPWLIQDHPMVAAGMNLRLIAGQGT